MSEYGIPPTQRCYQCALRACAKSGRQPMIRVLWEKFEGRWRRIRSPPPPRRPPLRRRRRRRRRRRAEGTATAAEWAAAEAAEAAAVPDWRAAKEAKDEEEARLLTYNV